MPGFDRRIRAIFIAQLLTYAVLLIGLIVAIGYSLDMTFPLKGPLLVGLLSLIAGATLVPVITARRNRSERNNDRQRLR